MVILAKYRPQRDAAILLRLKTYYACCDLDEMELPEGIHTTVNFVDLTNLIE
jgi:hypothetical protein